MKNPLGKFCRPVKDFVTFFYFNRNEIFLTNLSLKIHSDKRKIPSGNLLNFMIFYHIFQVVKICKKILFEKFTHVFLRKFSLKLKNKIGLM